MKKRADGDPGDTDGGCFFYKPHSFWLISLMVLIPGPSWLNLSISSPYQRTNRSTAGHRTKTCALLLHRKSQRLSMGSWRGCTRPPLLKALPTKNNNNKKKISLFKRNSSCQKNTQPSEISTSQAIVTVHTRTPFFFFLFVGHIGITPRWGRTVARQIVTRVFPL